MGARAPRITVFMPVYNREEYISIAIGSILRQSFGDFELLVIDDGSTDSTAEILARIDDPRLRVVRHETNQGIPATRNRGLELARGQFMAMLDSDDVAHPKRLARQLAFLDAHPDHAVVGSWARRIDEQGRPKKTLRRPLTWDRIRARLLFIGTIRTPSTLSRLDVLRRYRFRSEFPVCSDSDFWVRLALKERCANLAKPLIHYRIHPASATKSQKELVKDRKQAIAAYQLDRLGVKFNAEDLENHYVLRRPKRATAHPDLSEWAIDWLLRLLEANRERGIYPEPHFTLAVGERWYQLHRAHREHAGFPGVRLLEPRLRHATLAYLAKQKTLGRL